MNGLLAQLAIVLRSAAEESAVLLATRVVTSQAMR